MKKMDTLRAGEDALIKISEAMSLLRCGKKKIYALHRAGKLDMRKLGNSTRVVQSSVYRLINDLPQREPGKK